MRHSKFLFVSALCAALSLASCSEASSKGNPNVEDVDTDIPTGSGTMEDLDPEEQKDFLEKTATDLTKYFNPEDQREAVESAEYFIEKYSGLELPTEWTDDDEVNYPDYDYYDRSGARKPRKAFLPTNWVKAIMRAAMTPTIDLMTRAVFEESYVFQFSDFTGVFTPGQYRWEKTGESNNIEFRFKGKDGSTQSIVITASKDTYDFSESYDDWYGDDVYYENYTYRIPLWAEVTFNGAKNVLATTRVDYNLSSDKNDIYEANATAKATIANLSTTCSIEGRNTQLAANASLSVGGKNLVNSTTVVKGNHLTDLDYLERAADGEEDIYASMFKSGEGFVNVLDRVQINAEITDFAPYFEEESYFEYGTGWYQYSTESEALNAAKNAAAQYNKYTKSYIRYNNTTTQQARIQWGYVQHEYDYSSGEFMLIPLIYFPEDGTTYRLTEYLSENLGSAVSSFENIIKMYHRAFGW